MVQLDDTVLRAPERVAAVDRARRSAGTPVRFNAVARLAARLTRAEAAVITLVSDDYDEPLGTYGLPSRYAHARRWPARYSLCRYVISRGGALAVADMAADHDLRAHPLMTRAGVRAFAGVPLRDQDGRLLGSVTVADRTAREWTPADLAALSEIAVLLEPVSTKADRAAGMAVLGAFTGAEADGMSSSAEAEAEVQRVFIDALMDSLPVGVVAFDHDRRPVMGNRAWRELADQPPTASPDEVMRSLDGRLRYLDGTPMPVDDLPVFTALSGGPVRDDSAVLQRPGAPDRYVCGTSAPILSDSGELLGAVGTMTDVTAYRRSQDALHAQGRVAMLLNRAGVLSAVLPETLETLGTAMHWLSVSLWLVQAVGGVLHRECRWTARAADAGVEPGIVPPGESLIGRAWQQDRTLASADPGDLWPGAPRSAGAGRTAIAAPVHDGDTVVGVLACVSGSAGDDGDGDGDAVQLENAAEQISHFIARRRVVDLGDELVRAKDDFVALVGHELRTPVTSIAGSVDLLLTDGFDEDGPRLLDAISRNADALRHIIDDLLDMAQLESPAGALRLAPVDLAAVVAEAVARTPADAGPRVRTSLPTELTVDGDRARLAQVVENLLSNAVKYTPADGDVHVSLGVDGDMAVLAVADTGIGVPPEDRDHLFRRFYRAGNARNSVSAGTGLGLVMARTIAEAHGGTVDLDPGYAGGSRFVVRLPLRRARIG